MFSFLRSKKNDSANTSLPNSNLKKDMESNSANLNPTTPLEEKKPTEPTRDTWVFIWNMTASKVGHAAIQVGGSKPKMKDEDPGEYASIHPDSIPSTGFTSVIPLPAHIATNLSDDMETLGTSNNTSLDTDRPIQVKPIEDTKPLAPDHVYHFENLNTSVMSEHIKKTQDKVKTGKVGYQLLPNVNLVGFFKDSSAFVNQDPIDVELYRRKITQKQNDNQVYNCTTLVSDILNKGGLPVRRSTAKPWGITPNGLSSEISESAENNQGPSI
ncbi:hypothetical protein OQJ26_16355 [Legionella sp. PATHC038]|uniref:hypothetical protein n=1 Tax=Legionella sheltonii TaxID=2992041 RepID=UPI002244F02B|nr:hypothetical protein [Legionella sp. PATHC038]MCW8400354.1 hypothetical protein [Legionella sp. PATHC038]